MGLSIFDRVRNVTRVPANDRRAAPRERVLFRGKIVERSGLTADCSIRNLSAEGAALQLPEQTSSPNDFYLIVVRSGMVHRARTAWTRHPMVGVQFEASDDLTRPPVRLRLQGLRNLWAALAA